jgi:hypothetical protein
MVPSKRFLGQKPMIPRNLKQLVGSVVMKRMS